MFVIVASMFCSCGSKKASNKEHNNEQAKIEQPSERPSQYKDS